MRVVDYVASCQPAPLCPTSHPTATSNNNVMASSYHLPTTPIRSTTIPSYTPPSHPHQLQERRGRYTPPSHLHQQWERRGHSSSSSNGENDKISSHSLSSHVQQQRDVGRSPSREDGADTFRGESRPLVYPLPLSPGGTTQWWHRARDILTVMSPPQCYIPIAFSHDNNAYGLALHAYKYDIAHDHVHGLTPALMCLIRHLGRVSGQGPSITFEDWRDATPPPPWRDNYHEVDLLCLVAKQLNNELGLPSDMTYAYVSSLLWRGVQLQLLSLYKPIHDIELVLADIAYWRYELLQLKSIIVELVEFRHHSRSSNIYMQLDALTNALDVLTQYKHALHQVHAMSKSGQVASLSPTKLPLTLASHREMPISSPIPTTTQERGGDHQSMSVVYTPTTLPPTSSSHLHHHQARLGEVPTLPVHSYTAKQPPKDTSPRRRGKWEVILLSRPPYPGESRETFSKE